MISVAEAYKVVLSRAQTRPIVEVDLVHALGFVLAESIIADRSKCSILETYLAYSLLDISIRQNLSLVLVYMQI